MISSKGKSENVGCCGAGGEGLVGKTRGGKREEGEEVREGDSFEGDRNGFLLEKSQIISN